MKHSVYMIYYGETPAYLQHHFFPVTCYTSMKNARIRISQFKGEIDRIRRSKYEWYKHELKTINGAEVDTSKLRIVEVIPKDIARDCLQLALDFAKGDIQEIDEMEAMAKSLGFTIDEECYLRDEEDN